MDFTLSDDQALLLSAFDGLLDRYRSAPPGVHGYVAWDAGFQRELAESGFAEVASQPGYGALEAALLAEAAASCPVGVEAAASMLVGPLIGHGEGALALAWGLGKPVRHLPHARRVCVIADDAVFVGTPLPADIEPVESVAAYPMARLLRLPGDARRLSDEQARAVRCRAMIALAAEAAGLMRGAHEHTVRHVKERVQFGQPLGHFQAIQHRLAEDAQVIQACRLMTFRAAAADCPRLASIAALYAQEQMRKLIHDCHQFCGAMGLTLEFPLHLWTYRLKVLQGEGGGRAAHARIASALSWGAGTTTLEEAA